MLGQIFKTVTRFLEGRPIQTVQKNKAQTASWSSPLSFSIAFALVSSTACSVMHNNSLSDKSSICPWVLEPNILVRTPLKIKHGYTSSSRMKFLQNALNFNQISRPHFILHLSYCLKSCFWIHLLWTAEPSPLTLVSEFSVLTSFEVQLKTSSSCRSQLIRAAWNLLSYLSVKVQCVDQLRGPAEGLIQLLGASC